MRRSLFMVTLAVAAAFGLAGCSKTEEQTQPPKTEKKAEEVKPAEKPAEAPAPKAEPAKEPVKEAEKKAEAAKPAEVKALDTPEAILDQAIAAAGGLDALKAKLSSYSYKSGGTYFGNPYTMETTWKGPDKMLMGLDNGAIIMGYVGKECWTRMGSVVLDCPKEELLAAEEMLTVAQWTSLYPLKDGDAKLEKGPSETREGKNLVVLKVTRKDGSFSVEILFDEATLMGAGVRYTGHFMGQSGKLETWISEHKEFEGVKLPSKSVMKFNDSVVIEETVQSVMYGAIDDGAFAKPSTLVGVAKVRTLPERLVAQTTHKGTYQTMGMTIGMLYGWLGQNGIAPMGVPAEVYLTDPKTEPDPAKYVTEIWIPVGKPQKEPPADPNRSIKTLPAQEIVAMVQVGPFDKFAETAGKLVAWTEANGYELAGPPGMFSYSNPMDTAPENLISEVYYPIKKK